MSEVAAGDGGAAPAPAPEGGAPAPAEGGAAAAIGAEAPPAGWMGTNPDADVQSWAENKNFPDQNTMVKSYYHLEKLNGALKNGNAIDKPGEGASDADWNHFHNQLGRPTDPKDYAFMKDANQEETGWLADLMHTNGMSDKAATEISKGINEKITGMQSDQTAQTQADIDTDKAQLQKDWGVAHDSRIKQARSAAKEFGMTSEAIDSLEAAMGYAPLMKMLQSIGAKVGQDTFIEGEGHSSVMTPQAAQTAIGELNMDKDFMSAWLDNTSPGHAAAVAKKSRLVKFASGVAA